MAKTIQLKHNSSGVMKQGYYGYSWTTLFFGCFPALFRGDFLTFMGIFVVLFLLGLVTFGVGTFLGMFIWSFFYNKYYTRKLLEKGYAFSDTDANNEAAAISLGVSIPRIELPLKNKEPEFTSTTSYSIEKFSSEDKNLQNDAYKIFLIKKYPIEHNEVLKKYIFNNKLYESSDDALMAAHELELSNTHTPRKNRYATKDEAISLLSLDGVKIHESAEGKITVIENGTERYFYTESAFLYYANQR